MAIRVTVWNEFRHEKSSEKVAALYPNGLHAVLRDALACDEIEVRLVSLDEAEQGLPDDLLNSTDVLLWWGHVAHEEVSDTLVEKISARVHGGMGMIFLHSAHKSKPFQSIVGSTGNLTWGSEQKCVVWNLAPSHPIACGIPAHFELYEELYSEPFFIPKPDDLIFASWFEEGNLFRGGLTYTRGLGKIFYFHPGHERCESYYNVHVRRILQNAVRWCAPATTGAGLDNTVCPRQAAPIV